MPQVAATEEPLRMLDDMNPDASDRPTLGLRRRHNTTNGTEPRLLLLNDSNNRNGAENTDGIRILPMERTTRRPTSWTAWKVSQWYCWMSALGALLAILMAPSTTNTSNATTILTVQVVNTNNSLTKNNISSLLPNPSSSGTPEKEADAKSTSTTTSMELPLWRWVTQLLPAAAKETPPTPPEAPKHQQGPWWWPFGSQNDDDTKAADAATKRRHGKGGDRASPRTKTNWSWSTMSPEELKSSMLHFVLFTWIDPNLIPPITKPVDTIITNLIDKVLTSTLRILLIANWLIALTVLLHTAVADYFLGAAAERDAPPEPRSAGGGGFLLFKFLLISAMVAPDTLDVLILLSWYTALSFLRSLATLCAQHTERARLWQRRPAPGALQLLALVLTGDAMAALTCCGLFHGAGYGMVLLLTCDCLLLALDGITHMVQYSQAVREAQHSRQLQALEERQLALHRAVAADDVAARSRALDHEMEALEQQHGHTTAVRETVVFVVQLWTDFLTMAHFVHIWTLHGLHFTFIDGVIALHLHSALVSAIQKLAARRAAQRIARELDALCANATAAELQQQADVCCICLGTMSADGGVKKVACGHLYHATCLRDVLERARSMETARCPLCRATFVPRKEAPRDDPVATVVPPPDAPVEGERALFRFTTEGLFPHWIPLPAFSFEVVRRPLEPDAPPRNDPAPEAPSLVRRLLLLTGAVPRSPEEEQAALDQLVDLFPQYDRGDLLRALRDRGGALDAVVESILLGALAPRDNVGR